MANDPFYSNTVLLLHADTTGDPLAAALVAGFSGKRAAPEIGTLYAAASLVTANGRPCVDLTAYSTAYYGTYGTATGVFDGDFTIEFWFYLNANLAKNVLFASIAGTTNTYQGAYAYFSSAGVWSVVARGANLTSFTFLPSIGEWHHFALVSSGGAQSVYIDGVRKTTGAAANNTSYTACNGARLGFVTGLSSTGFNGYGSDLRVYKGIAKYSGMSFSVPTWPSDPYSMHPDSSLAARYNTATGSAILPYTGESKFGGGCLRFDGASGLVLPASTDWNFGTGDFTVEAWVKPYVIPGGGVTTDMLVFGSFNATPHFIASLDNATLAPVLRDGTTAYTASSGVATGMWTHVAWSRQNGTLRIFESGEKTLEAACATNFAASTTVGVGYENSSNTRYFNGLMDDLRVTKGVARYVTDFTPPEQAFADGQAVISGTVRDVNGALCSRRVNVHSRTTGRLVGCADSDAVTGAFSIGAAEDCYAVVLDPTGTYNALILDRLTPG